MIERVLRCFVSAVTAASLALAVPGGALAQPGHNRDADDFPTKTPIKHVVVIFQENVSFDHYFATYPYAANSPHEPHFNASDDTPRVNNLLNSGLMMNNPNATGPFRLDRTQAVTCSQNHNYADEQKAFNKGLMDNFVTAVGVGNGNIAATTPPATLNFIGNFVPGTASPFLPNQFLKTSTNSFQGYCFDAGKGKGLVMGYYDGNTVTAFWNYAQNFAMSDNSYGSNFGPSAVGALNLISGNTGTATLVPLRPNGTAASASGNIFGSLTTGPVIGDPRPGYDDCVTSNPQLATTNMVTVVGKNVGDLLNEKHITWGWFMGGFAPTVAATSSTPAVCGQFHTGLAGFGSTPLPDNMTTVGDYIPHHEPFEYYLQSSNQHHVRPSSISKIGKDDGMVRHQYDLTDFYTALSHDNLPAVSFLKAGAYQDGHPGYSDPLDEQAFVVKAVNALMASDEWRETAIIIVYDDSDGWYDHVMDPVLSQSNGSDDNLTGPGACGTTPAGGVAGRCGLGPRQPLMLISPWAKENYVDHSVTDQASVLRFIEDNFLESARIGGTSTDVKAGTIDNMFDFDDNDHDGRWSRDKDERHHRTLFLDPTTGQEVSFGGH